MKPAATPGGLAADPIDRYWIGESHLVWCRDAASCGSIHWGQPTTRDVTDLTRALELADHPALAAGFEVFMDSRSVDQVDWTPFGHLLEYLRGRLPAWSTRIRQHAVVVPAGPSGALLAGMVPLLGVTYSMRFFDDTEPALTWLAWHTRPDSVASAHEAAELARVARGVTPLVHRFRAWLEGALRRPTIEAASSALGLSPRSLQRELRAGGTSFTAEVQAVRVRVACALLAQTDEKVEVIAREVGCVSASQRSTIFRKVIGETPARYRVRSGRPAS